MHLWAISALQHGEARDEMDDYHILERIGEGSFGKVYRGRRKYSGHIVALKFVTKRGKSAKELANLRQEVRVVSCLASLMASNNGRSIVLRGARSASCVG